MVDWAQPAISPLSCSSVCNSCEQLFALVQLLRNSGFALDSQNFALMRKTAVFTLVAQIAILQVLNIFLNSIIDEKYNLELQQTVNRC